MSGTDDTPNSNRRVAADTVYKRLYNLYNNKYTQQNPLFPSNDNDMDTPPRPQSASSRRQESPPASQTQEPVVEYNSVPRPQNDRVKVFRTESILKNYGREEEEKGDEDAYEPLPQFFPLPKAAESKKRPHSWVYPQDDDGKMTLDEKLIHFFKDVFVVPEDGPGVKKERDEGKKNPTSFDEPGKDRKEVPGSRYQEFWASNGQAVRQKKDTSRHDGKAQSWVSGDYIKNMFVDQEPIMQKKRNDDYTNENIDDTNSIWKNLEWSWNTAKTQNQKQTRNPKEQIYSQQKYQHQQQYQKQSESEDINDRFAWSEWKNKMRWGSSGDNGARQHMSSQYVKVDSNPTQIFADEKSASAFTASFIIAISVAIFASYILKHIAHLKKEGQLVESVDRWSRTTGWNLYWILALNGIHVEKESEIGHALSDSKHPSKKAESGRQTVPTPKLSIPGLSKAIYQQHSNVLEQEPDIGTTSGHPRRGMKAFDSTLNTSKLGFFSSTSPSSWSPLPSPLSSEPSSPTSQKLQTTYSASTSSHIPRASSHYLPTRKPWFTIKSRPRFSVRDDPSTPDLASAPVPIARMLDTADSVWESTVEAVAWCIGATAVRPVMAVESGIETVVGGMKDWMVWGARRVLQTGKRLTGRGGRVVVVEKRK